MNEGREKEPIRYVIVSPVKDEERYIELTLKSVIHQTLRPLRWLIVDDGSRDRTPEIIESYLANNSFIRLVRHRGAGERKLAFAEVRAFNWGCELIGDLDYDYIVKLDCDLSFGPTYFEEVLKRFRADGRIGIASGVYWEPDQAGAWKEVIMPAYHAAGASKVLRKACFDEIGRFTPAPGWDTVDEIRAMHRGWKTLHFRELRMNHHKPEGSSIGAIKNSMMQGEAYYRSGGSKIFFIFKVLHRSQSNPRSLAGAALFWGYLKAILLRKKILITQAEATLYKSILLNRLVLQIKSFFRADRCGPG